MDSMEKVNKMNKEVKTKVEKFNKLKKELMTCMHKNCKKVVKNYKDVLQKAKEEIKKLLHDYYLNKISEKELLSRFIIMFHNNMSNVKYTNYIKCLLKNCYKNYKPYIDFAYMGLNNNYMQKFILMKAKEYNVEKEVKRFLMSLKDQSTFNKIKMTRNILVSIMQKLYKENEKMIIKMIKENKKDLKEIITMIDKI